MEESKHKYKTVYGRRTYYRFCPSCNSELNYSYIQSICLANKRNNLCRKCSNKLITTKQNRINGAPKGIDHPFYGKKLSIEIKLKISAALSGEKHPMYGKNHSKETVEKLKNDPRVRHYGKDNGFYGKTHSDETKKRISDLAKLRIRPEVSTETRIKMSQSSKGRRWSPEQIEKIRINSKEQFIRMKEKEGILKIGYNKNACNYIDALNKKYNFNFKHALNGGEKRILFYLVDGYDEEKNIVFEYDERYHFDIYGNLKHADIIRMTNIICKLNCKFFRYNEPKGILVEYIKETGKLVEINDGDLKI
jgi:hypothetical protein